ncbi:hypothetical protein [Polymorphospora lycopeni]|uniref:Uncharacterized protein n=1 Tax=Polymorphospora lycopeni TaxID=3140240 RepID=A0ABV5CL32_9ACTN
MTDTTTNNDWCCIGRCDSTADDWDDKQCMHCECCCSCMGCLYGPPDGMLMFPDVATEVPA